jgi:hypothetical protein
MDVSRALEQHIAVFGESGSGKTVLLSSFYGVTQEPHYLKQSLFHVVAENIGQGARLHRNYLGMKNSAQLPASTRFSGQSYSFSIKLKDGSNAKVKRSQSFDALRLVWHDYPGEWFEQEVSGPEEAQRKVATFRSLLGSDVALLLVDAQRLIDNSGEEERYLKSLFSNFRNGLLSLKDDLLEDGKPLLEFPRIWVMALSKSDLMPHVDVFAFRDLLVEKASDDIDELRTVIASLVEASDALSVGEDLLLLSSAKFDAGIIRVTEHVGLEMILPMAAMLPFERHIRWARAKHLPGKLAENLLRGVGPMAHVLFERLSKLPGPLGRLSMFVRPSLDQVTTLAGDKLREMNAEALAKQDYLRAILTGFRMDLERGEAEHRLLRSRR